MSLFPFTQNENEVYEAKIIYPSSHRYPEQGPGFEVTVLAWGPVSPRPSCQVGTNEALSD